MHESNTPSSDGDKGSPMVQALRVVGMGLALFAASVVGFVTGVTPRLDKVEQDNAAIKTETQELRRSNERIERKLDRLIEGKGPWRFP